MNEVRSEEELTPSAEPSGTEQAKTSAAEETVGAEPVKKKSSKKFWLFVYQVVLPVLLSGIVRAFGVYVFVTPNNFAPGGINGVAVLLEYAFKPLWGDFFNSGFFLFVLNVPIFFIAFFFLGKKEAIVSTLSMVVSSVLLVVMGMIPELTVIQYSASGESVVHGLLGAIAGGIFLGVALVLMIKSFGTSGGTTVLASLINKKFKNLSVSALTSAFDAIVVFSSFFVYNQGASFAVKLDPVLLALVSLFVTSKVCDGILQGFKSAYKFEIITSDPEGLSQEIMQKLHRGVTCMNAEGMYSHENKSMLVCVIRKRQLAELQRIIRRYPGSFAYFVPTSEVYGRFLK